MNKKIKNNKGITLIALIITIIILLILAIVSIKILTDQGIIGHAKQANKRYTEEQEKELITLGYSEYKMNKYIPEGSNQDSEDLQTLKEYFGKLTMEDVEAGQDENGAYYYVFKSNDIIQDAETSIKVIGIYQGTRQEQCLGNSERYFYIEYKNNIYKTYIDDSGFLGKVEFHTTTLDLTENQLEQEALDTYFKDNAFNEIFDDYTCKFKGASSISDAKTSIVWIGQDIMQNHLIQYKDRIYKVNVTNGKYTGLELISMVKTSSNNQLKVQGANVEGDEEYGWTITFTETGHIYMLYANGEIQESNNDAHEETEDEKLLKTYFLGENGEGKVYTDVMQMVDSDNELGFSFKFISNDVIGDASTSIQVFNEMIQQTYNEKLEVTGMAMYISYNSNIYKIIISTGQSAGSEKITNVSLIYSPTGKEGQTIEYSYDGTEANKKQWTILYDHGNTIEIVSPDALGNLTLGAGDEQASGSTDIEKAIDSYNNAITRLNRYCQTQITNSNKLSVRSVGSNPDNPNSENNKKVVHSGLESSYTGVGKASDDNYEQDLIRMLYWNIVKVTDSKDYWLASRRAYYYVSMSNQFISFSLLTGNSYANTFIGEGNADPGSLWGVIFAGNYGMADPVSHAVRPIVKINQ